jgi:glycosyltransferase involved in cell wall biosynthesis
MQRHPEAPERPALSVLVTTYNEASNLPLCLAGCTFADEIVVVDSGSNDGTLDIARAHGVRILSHVYEGPAEQKNWALERVSHDWVLILDADERVTPELRDEVRAVLGSAGRRDGYWLRRRSTFLGREIRGCGWNRDRVLRLFDRRRGRYAPRRVHEEVVVDGSVGSLANPLLHHPCPDLTTWLGKVERYAHWGAEEAWTQGRRAGWCELACRPPLRFVKQYFLQQGFRDGIEGLLLCGFSAFGVFLKYARLRELGQRGPQR